MSLFRLILLSVRHFWKMNAAVACGVAVGTAVLTGALLVGDSMQGSLRDLVLAGLGRIDEVLVADHFFREQLAGDKSSGNPAAPVDLLFRQPGNGRSGAAGPRGPGQPHRLRRAVLATWQRRSAGTARSATRSFSTNRWRDCLP